jgi:hypothetical protein
VLRVKENGDVEEIASGLFLPTAMTFGPDGDLYVSWACVFEPQAESQLTNEERPPVDTTDAFVCGECLAVFFCRRRADALRHLRFCCSVGGFNQG